jgi:monoamine oxidase
MPGPSFRVVAHELHELSAQLPSPERGARPRSKALASDGRNKRVVIIGAGLAGMSAAYRLSQAGHDVTVLEASDRAGGRIVTVREPFTDGLHAEAGAMFVLPRHTEVLSYVAEFGLETYAASAKPSGSMMFMRGVRIANPADPAAPWPVDLTDEERKLGYAGMFILYVLDTALQSIGDPHQPGWPAPEVARYDSMSFHEFLTQQGASPAAIEVLRMGFFDMWGEGIETVSALCLLRELNLCMSPMTTSPEAQPSGESSSAPRAIAGGTERLTAAFAQRLASQIRFGSPVVRIEADGDDLCAVVRTGSGFDRVSASHIVCTIPFSVLRSVELAVPISKRKQWAIDRMEYSSATRVFLEMKECFWVAEDYPPLANTDTTLCWVNDQTPAATTSGILEAYTYGPTARALAAMAPDERIRSILDEMEKVYPGARDNFVAGASHCWDDDPWARGGYPTFLPGDLTMLSPYAGTPEGNLHFAGDHTSLLPGYMEGAIESGHRAAAEVHGAS